MILQSPRNCIKYELDLFFKSLLLDLGIHVTIYVTELNLSVCDHNILLEGECLFLIFLYGIFTQITSFKKYELKVTT